MHKTQLDAAFDVDELASAIMGEESLGFVFKDNAIEPVDGVPANVATFEVDPDGGYPTDCVIRLEGGAAPAGHARQWSGRMLVAGVEKTVELFRAKP